MNTIEVAKYLVEPEGILGIDCRRPPVNLGSDVIRIRFRSLKTTPWRTRKRRRREGDFQE